MEFRDILNRRTIRFFEQKPVPDDHLRKLVDAARLASAAANNQNLRYRVIRTPDAVKAVFAHTNYGGRVKPRRSPEWGVNSPCAFIALTAPAEMAERPLLHADAGAAVQSIEFAAWDLGLGACWLGAIDRAEIAKILGLDEKAAVIYLVAIGYPAECPVRDDIAMGDEVGYYLDAGNVLHVPKYTVDAITEWC